MARTKSIKRDSVFGRTATVPTPVQGIKDEKRTTQTAVWLADEETNWIDDRCTEIKRGGWKGITRSAFIRALIQAAMDKQLDIAGVTGEAELKDRLV